MKTESEIRAAMKACSKAQKTDNPKLCPIWPEEETLYCIDCTCRYAMRWVLGEPVEPDFQKIQISEKDSSGGEKPRTTQSVSTTNVSVLMDYRKES